MKVFRQQLNEAKVALSSLFIGTYQKILPYVNAILMVIKEMANAIATMFGIKLEDYNSGIATSANEASDGISGIGDSASGAAKKAKELKRELLSFDQVHNLSDPSSSDSGSGSGSAGGLAGGIDQRLLDAIQGYDNGMDKVRMKATEIRDKIMEWLGFTKLVDEETGKVHFVFTGTNTTMGKIIIALKDIVKYGKQAVKNVFDAMVKDFNSGAFGTAIVTVFNGVANALKFIAENKWAAEVLAKCLELFIAYKVAIKPLISLMTDLSATFMKNGASIKEWTNSASGMGTAIGLLLASVTNMGLTIKSGLDRIQAAKDFFRKPAQESIDLLAKLRESAQSAADSSMSYLNVVDDLSNELNSYVDANGKVKKADEERVKVILTQLNSALGTEYKLVGNQITQNGKAIKSYGEVKKAVEQLIITKKTEILLEAYKEEYAQAYKKRKENIDKLTAAQEKYNKTKEELSQLEWKLENDRIHMSNEEFKRYKQLKERADTQLQGVQNLNVAVLSAERDIKNYDDLMAASLSGNINQMNSALKKYGVEVDNTMNKTFNNVNTKAKETKTNITNTLSKVDTTVKVKADQNSLNSTKEAISKFLGNTTFTFQPKGTTYASYEFAVNRALGGVFANGSWSSIPQYATGGLPNHGSMFVAGEAGAEIVGHIGGRTEVLNQSQIASAIYSAVVSAMSQSGSQGVEVYLHTDEGVIVDRINQKTRQTGKSQIYIPY